MQKNTIVNGYGKINSVISLKKLYMKRIQELC
jgi:hypothetical protein